MPTNRTIQAVVWDIDDTIFDYTTADRVGMRDHLEAEGLLDGFDTVEQALGHWREITDLQWARYAAKEIDFLGQRRDRVRAFLEDPDLTDAEADAWFGRYIARYEAAWGLFPDVLPALDTLARSHRHAVLSNSTLHVQEPKLRTLGIWDRFEAVLCAAELGVSKPAPEAFHAACEVLGLSPHQVAYVGDHPEIDARGAAEAGLFSVWLDRGAAATVSGLRRITSLDELSGVLRRDMYFGAPSTFR
jgi:putative hydrolase of the HAD superfamily